MAITKHPVKFNKDTPPSEYIELANLYKESEAIIEVDNGFQYETFMYNFDNYNPYFATHNFVIEWARVGSSLYLYKVNQILIKGFLIGG